MNKRYMVHVARRSGTVFVKEYSFFQEQGGMSEPWGKNWVEVMAMDIEDARRKGCLMRGARPYEKQAK